MNEMQRAEAREKRKRLAGQLKEAVDAGRLAVEEVARRTKSEPTTVLAWMAGFQTPQKRAARRLARLLEELSAGRRR